MRWNVPECRLRHVPAAGNGGPVPWLYHYGDGMTSAARPAPRRRRPAQTSSQDDPAQRYAAARRRQELASTPLVQWREQYPFELDPFQEQACDALARGRGVLVAAPTGSGKTVVGEFAVHLALSSGRKAFYTTPIKALSNQKFADLVRRYGAESVGLLTGDNTVNGEAPVVVMTTEVLRNMLYADSPTLQGLGYVVMDEVHYLADRMRGAVWEEVIIHLPEDVLLVSLSATVSNAEEFGAWLDTVRGDTEVVVSEDRPVPLWQHVLAGPQLYDLFAEDSACGTADARGRTGTSTTVNPLLHQLHVRGAQGVGEDRSGRRGGGRPGGRGASRHRPPSRTLVIETLDAAGLLPMITFIFSRAGCDAAVEQCMAGGLRLTSQEEREQIRAVVRERCSEIPEEDLAVLGFEAWCDSLERGVAAHHAGLLPTFKEVVEELFSRGLVKAVFATETLALGINMPARSVVLERLVKWNGETHADVTPGEYTQLTGRAGRRGIDVEGHAVVLWHPGLDPRVVAGLASTRTYPLRSSFRPTYNMTVNLVHQVGRPRAREILETSFAQFQADRAVVGLARQARHQERQLAEYAQAMTCHAGDFAEYAQLRQAIAEREASLARSDAGDRRSEALASLDRLRRGDVIRVPAGRRPGWAVVVEPGQADGPDGALPVVLNLTRQVRRLSGLDVPTAVTPLTRIPVPRNFNPRDPAARRDLASSLRNALGAADHGPQPRGRRRAQAADDEQLAALRRQLRAHPCHGCSDREQHARWAERWLRLQRETSALLRRIESRTNTIARVFDRVCDLLDERGYLDQDTVTAHGQMLRHLYGEADLLLGECLRAGLWDGLDGPGLAACASALVYESRRDDRSLTPRLPGGPVREALVRMGELWANLEAAERDHQLDPTPEPDVGLAWPIHRWARGQRLEAVLRDCDLAAGDFVRWCKQVVDLLGQIEQAAGDDPEGQALRRAAADAVTRIRRGVVAYSSVG